MLSRMHGSSNLFFLFSCAYLRFLSTFLLCYNFSLDDCLTIIVRLFFPSLYVKSSPSKIEAIEMHNSFQMVDVSRESIQYYRSQWTLSSSQKHYAFL
jgi:hypothetical protein